jgi:Tfp pilus assembly protein PilN
MALAAPPRTDVPINLLPPQVRSRQHVRRVFGTAALGAIGLVVLLMGITAMQRLQISSARRTLQTQRAEAVALRAQVGNLQQYEVLQASVTSSRTLLGTALSGDVAFSRFLDDLDTAMPGDSWLTSLTLSAKPNAATGGVGASGTAQYGGYVTSFPGLSGWLDTMSRLKGLRFVYLSNGSKQDVGGRKVVSFSASANLTEQMLSHRCQGESTPCP